MLVHSSKCLQPLALGQAKKPGGQSSDWIFHMESRDPSDWAIACRLPGYALAGNCSLELGLEPWTLDSDMECRCPKR